MAGNERFPRLRLIRLEGEPVQKRDVELFRQHFTNGDPRSEVPELQGIGLMSDGDQTGSISAADYAGFVLYK